MNKFKFSIVCLVFLLGSILSCTKDNSKPDASSTTVAEDKQKIGATFDNSLNCAMQIRDGAFFQAFVKFLDLQNGDVLSENWIDNLSTELDNVANLNWIDENSRFSMNYFSGNYEWNKSAQSWTKTTNSQVIVNFPSEETQQSNNCTFKITDYSDAPFLVDNETIYLPTSVQANLIKTNSEIFNLNMACTYNSSGFPVPVDATITIGLNPFTYTFKIKRLTTTQFEINAGIFSGSDCSTTLYSKISLANDDYENLDLEQDLNNIQFNYKKGDINISGTWDAKTYNSLYDPTTDQLNSTLNFVVNYNSQKIGDLRFKDVGSERELFIYYKDGTSENTSLYYDPFYSDFKAMCKPYFGDFNKKSVSKYFLNRKIINLKSKISGWFK
ncbi:MAG: hypothetical protein ACOYMF_12025 [Bacteroidales bacterium]